MLNIAIITLFPEMFAALQQGITGRAQKNNLISLHYFNPRDYTVDRHRTVDDRPYGGGPGMLMKVAPLQAAIQAAKSHLTSPTLVSYLSPQGKRFDQSVAQNLVLRENLLLVAGRYEGVDERLRQLEFNEEWSIGDFVLSGGELPAMCIIDAITRLLPGALGDAESATQDSFMDGLLDHPHYTRPEKIGDLRVPDVLLNGNHAAIKQWRLKQALGQTWLYRPDLLEKRRLNKEEAVLLAEFISEQKKVSGVNNE
jgi:tRNA (guanine37-N1)-methyltransferase